VLIIDFVGFYEELKILNLAGRRKALHHFSGQQSFVEIVSPMATIFRRDRYSQGDDPSSRLIVWEE
jgi:hypothetical protein